jgi:NAD(P)-dependent dehydrogenase (short-subunit alcohol dehydrogenase family)
MVEKATDPASLRSSKPAAIAADTFRDLFSLRGKVAWITGASRGLGRAVAAGLAEAGACIAITARSEADLASLAQELGSPSKVKVAPGNVADPARMADIAENIAKDFGAIDILVNTAGISPTVRESEDLATQEWRAVLDVNLSGTFFCCREAGRLMLARGSGSIINVSSAHGSTGVARMAAYGASKGGVENLTRSLAVEWASSGVRVNCLAPGYMVTDLTRAYLSSRFGDHVRANIPMGQPGTDTDLLGAALFLASDASSYVTGAIIPVDGGWTAQ